MRENIDRIVRSSKATKGLKEREKHNWQIFRIGDINSYICGSNI